MTSANGVIRYIDAETRNPDFFLSASGEKTDLSEPRACWYLAGIQNATSDDHMLIEIRPPMIGQQYGLGARDITNLVISPKSFRKLPHPITAWPADVYVSRIMDDAVIETLTMTATQIEMIAWASIYPSLEEAERARSLISGK